MLIGVSGAGKTTLSRFVAWINGLSLFQIKVSRTNMKVWFCIVLTCNEIAKRQYTFILGEQEGVTLMALLGGETFL